MNDLNKFEILECLHGKNLELEDIVVFQSIDSTNNFLLKEFKGETRTKVCLAEYQTEGRGQYGRQWISPSHRNILASLRFTIPKNHSLNGLSIIMGLAVLNTLKDLGINSLRIKWPNDVYVEDGKIAGILVENRVVLDSRIIVVGIGLNWRMEVSVMTQKIADISGIIGNKVSRNCIVGRLLFHSIQLFEDWKTIGFLPYLNAWQEIDYLYDKHVKVSMGNEEFVALGVGIDSDGALLVKYQGEIKRIFSAQVSVLE